MFSQISGLARLSFRVPGLLKKLVTPEEAQRSIEEGMKIRSERFLAHIERNVYQNPISAHRKLLDAAGCEFADVKQLVSREGIEEALRILADSGVYVSFEEYKGRQPAVRGSQSLQLTGEGFRNPRNTDHLTSTSGGSRGRPVRIGIDVNNISQMTPYWVVFFAENGCLGSPLILWTPGHAGVVARQLSCAKGGQRMTHWFVAERMTRLRNRWYAAAVHSVVGKIAGFPPPEYVPYNQPERILDRLAPLLAAGQTPCMNTAPSAAVKLSVAAQTRAISLSGLTFLLGAEPLTPARRVLIEESGAKAVMLYGSTEAPWVGGQCQNPEYADEIHVLSDRYAIIPARRAKPAPAAGAETLLITSLLPTSSTILLNTDIGDRAFLYTRDCGCLYARLGSRLCLHTIRSSDKVTSYGVTFQVADFYKVVEEVLPHRFGGGAGDYQLVETENEGGFQHYTILVNPELPGIDETTLRSAFLTETAKLRNAYGMMVLLWEKENAVSVRRGQPIASPRGKVFPFYRIAGPFPP